MNDAMDHLSHILPSVLRKRGLQAHAEGALVVLRAQQWLEEQLPFSKDAISVRSLKEGTLHITCTHSIALQECQSSIADLKQYLSDNCGFARIATIRISRS